MAKNTLVNDPVLRELDAIKRLLALLMVKAGTEQKEIAIALGIDQSSVSRMLPARKIKGFQPNK
jgi:predicted transcriptional regulator